MCTDRGVCQPNSGQAVCVSAHASSYEGHSQYCANNSANPQDCLRGAGGGWLLDVCRRGEHAFHPVVLTMFMCATHRRHQGRFYTTALLHASLADNTEALNDAP